MLCLWPVGLPVSPTFVALIGQTDPDMWVSKLAIYFVNKWSSYLLYTKHEKIYKTFNFAEKIHKTFNFVEKIPNLCR